MNNSSGFPDALFQSGISLSICLHEHIPNAPELVYAITVVSIRHQPEYLPSHVRNDNSNTVVVVVFQSGISLSICLHVTLSRRSLGGGGFVVSIRHQPEYLPSRSSGSSVQHGFVDEFQSGISLSICLHLALFAMSFVVVTLNVSIRHQPEYLPSRAGSSASI